MKLPLPQALAACAAVLMLTACASGPQAPSTPPAPAPASTEQPESTQDDCEASDWAEGDGLADCLGVGDPEAESEPVGVKPSKTPRCKPGQIFSSGKCRKK